MPLIMTQGKTHIYFKDWGTGQPIVFSHGWPLTADAWNEQMMFLVSEGCRQCRRGLGFTNPARRLAILRHRRPSQWLFSHGERYIP